MSPFAAADGDDVGDAHHIHHRHNRRPYPNLLTDLQLHNDYFDSIVNMIPAKLYISGGGASGGGGSSSSSSDNVKYRKGQHVESKEAKRAKDKAAKYDPNRVETTLQTKKRVRMEEMEMDEEGSDDDVEDDIVMSDDDDDDDDDDGSEVTEPTGNIGSSKKISHNKNKNTNTVSCTETSPVSVNLDEDVSSSSYPSRIEALRAKLRAKVAALTGTTKTVGAMIDGDSSSGGGDGGTDNPALTSKRAARRAEKKRRMEAAKQRAGKTGSTSVVTSADGSNNNKKRRLDTTTSIGKSSMTALSSSSAITTTITTTTVANDLATIDYQSLAGLRPKLDGALDNKSLVGIGAIPSSSSNKGKKKASLEKLLADAERKQARLRELKSSTNEADKEKARSIVWQDTFKVASVGGGDNLRKMNDPAVIKKAIKRKAKKKVASAKAWNSRIEKVHDAVSERQRIRSHNIDQRKLGGATAANLSSKRIVTDKDSTTTEGGGDGGKDSKGEKRRRLGPHSNRAGFEGKKNGFINGKQQQGEGGSTSGGGGGKMGGR
jgi:DNA excision repair protein ERCC-4